VRPWREADADGNGKLDRLELRLMCALVSRHSRDVDIDERRLRARVMAGAVHVCACGTTQCFSAIRYSTETERTLHKLNQLTP
jgi:hypothetical protein